MPRAPAPVDTPERRQGQFLWFVAQVPEVDQAVVESVDHGGPRDLPAELQERH